MFRCLLPLTVHYDSNSQSYDAQIEANYTIKMTPIYIENLLCTVNILENTLKENNYEQMAVLSPLILLPYLNRAKNEMNKILLQCMISINNNIKYYIMSFIYRLL